MIASSLATVGGWIMPPDPSTGSAAPRVLGSGSWAAATAAAGPLEGTFQGGVKPSCSIGRQSHVFLCVDLALRARSAAPRESLSS